MYRNHKSLPPAAKVNSLYVFDAFSRAARQQVLKLGLTGDIHTEPGNHATFLLKIEGILEGLFRDMIKTEHTECKVSLMQRSFGLSCQGRTRRRWGQELASTEQQRR